MRYNDSNIECFFIQNLLNRKYTPSVRVLNDSQKPYEGEVFIRNGVIYYYDGVNNISKGTYNPGDYYSGITRNYIASSNIYTSGLHEALGDYLRMLRDCKGVNFMSLYNCFSNRYEDDFALPITLDTNKFAYRSNFSTARVDSNNRLITIPVRFNTTYNIFCKKPTSAKIQLALYNKKDLIPYTGVYINTFSKSYSEYLQNKFINAPLNLFKPVSINTDTITPSFLERNLEPCLFLFIEVPKDCAEYIVVLETLSSESIYNVMYNNTLLTNNSHSALPYSNKLMGYLLEFFIDYANPIPQNIERVQQDLSKLKSSVYPIYATKGLEYKLDSINKNALLTGLGKSQQLNGLVIPTALYNSNENTIYTVNSIDPNVFKNYTGEYIVLSQALKRIPANTFKENSNLKSITFGPDLTYIGEDAFKDCNALIYVNFEGDINNWCLITFNNTQSNPLANTNVTFLYNNNAPLSGVVTLDSRVTAIPLNTFKSSHITDIIIPGTLTYLDADTFQNCNYLQYHIDNSIRYISNNTICMGPANKLDIKNPKVSLLPSTRFILHDVLGYGAFNGSSNITHLNIPAGVVEIASDTFYGTYRLQNINFEGTLTQWCKITFDGNYSNPLEKSTTAYLPRKPLQINGTELSGDIVLSEISTIPAYTFRGSQIESLKISEGLVSIGKSACEEVQSLKTLELPDSLQSIGISAFYNCPIENLTIHSLDYTNFKINGTSTSTKVLKSNLVNLIVTGECAVNSSTFSSSSSSSESPKLREVFLKNCTSIGQAAFNGCGELSNVYIGGNLNSIEQYAFRGCSKLGVVEFSPQALFTHTGYCTFLNCSSLKTIILPHSVTTIDAATFENCTKLQSVTLPQTLTTIETEAFYNCSSLTDITLQGTRAQWSTISKGSNWDSNTGDYTVHCTDGDLSKGGDLI